MDHPEVREVIASTHCVERFRQRYPVREPGVDTVMDDLVAALEGADVSAWPPAWAVSDRPVSLWAATADLAFPLVPTADPGQWLAVTCLRRSKRT